MRGISAPYFLELLATCAVLISTATGAPSPISSTSQQAKVLPDSYIVLFKQNVTVAAAAEHYAWVQQLQQRLTQGTQEHLESTQSPMSLAAPSQGHLRTFGIGDTPLGYAGRFCADAIEQIRKHHDVSSIYQGNDGVATNLMCPPKVDFVESDSEIKHVTTAGTDTESVIVTQDDAPWGLGRISHREELEPDTYSKYVYDSAATGEGVDIYTLGTGVYLDHEEFKGRASWGRTFVGEPDVDSNGNGTLSAGTIAGKTFGVAKKANIIAVKVINDDGWVPLSALINGISWVADQAAVSVNKGSVMHIGVTLPRLPVLDAAVNAAINAGVHVVVPAGDGEADACDFSPALLRSVITVAASNIFDEAVSFSNHGSCVDIFAPGQNIQSTFIGSRSATEFTSSTSIASAHVAGLLAVLLSPVPIGRSIPPIELKARLLGLGTKDALDIDFSDTPNVRFISLVCVIVLTTYS